MREERFSWIKVMGVVAFSLVFIAGSGGVHGDEQKVQKQSEIPLHEHLELGFDSDKKRASKDDTERQLAQVYTHHSFHPFWVTKDNTLTRATQTVLKVLENADKEGLNAEDYRLAIQMIREQDMSDPYKIEVEITKAVLDYLDHLYGERLNPKRTHKELYLRQKEIDAAALFTDRFDDDPTMAWFLNESVQHPEYQFLKTTLAKLREQKEINSFPELPPGPNLEKGRQDPRVQILLQQLKHLNYLDENLTTTQFDQDVDDAVRSFQRDNYLMVDGVVGPNTRAALNGHDIEDRIRQVIVTMERWRWMPQTFPQRYVMVNIAGFDLTAVESGQIKLHMPVIIGKKYRRTPVFNSEIYSIRFNPSWHVPRSIAVRDKLRKIQKDPGYLSRKGYVLYDTSGHRISPQSVNWSSVNRDNWAYRLRQVPGSHNALGKIRFTIKSPFNIYLHDTNQPELFKKANRSISSGCIRVSDPESLAAFVFNGQNQFNHEKISQRMQGVVTENVSLKSPVPVYINYLTVWQDKQTGQARFGQDIYGQDKAIWRALGQS